MVWVHFDLTVELLIFIEGTHRIDGPMYHISKSGKKIIPKIFICRHWCLHNDSWNTPDLFNTHMNSGTQITLKFSGPYLENGLYIQETFQVNPLWFEALVKLNSCGLIPAEITCFGLGINFKHFKTKTIGWTVHCNSSGSFAALDEFNWLFFFHENPWHELEVI